MIERKRIYVTIKLPDGVVLLNRVTVVIPVTANSEDHAKYLADYYEACNDLPDGSLTYEVES